MWVSGVYCPGLRKLGGRPASAPTLSRGGAELLPPPTTSSTRPASAPAHVHFSTKAASRAVTGTATSGPPVAGYPAPQGDLPGSITASWLTGLLYSTGVLDADSGIIVARICEVTDIYGSNGVVYRIKVAYGGPRQTKLDCVGTKKPSSFVLKLYDSDELLPNARRELLFYSTLAGGSAVRAPKCLWGQLKPSCGAQSRCDPKSWPRLEDFLGSPRWCGFSEEPQLFAWDSDASSMSGVTDSSWGATSSEAWNPDSPRARPSIAARYTKALRSVGITRIGHLRRLESVLPSLRAKGVKQAHLVTMLERRVAFEPRAVSAALLLEDVEPVPAPTTRPAGADGAQVLPDDSPANIWMEDAALVVAQVARLHASWWGAAQRLQEHELLKHGRAYNTNTPDSWCERLDEMWPTLSRYLHKFRKLKRRFSVAEDVKKHLVRPRTLLHGDLHPANLTMLAKADCVVDSADRAASFALFDWAEINVGCGPEELAHFLLRARIWACDDAGNNARLCEPKQVARPLLQRYYKVLTRSGVVS
eukprot:COSAG01_NODE_4224_length_5226_cov_4.995514_2_plen_532_part_00